MAITTTIKSIGPVSYVYNNVCPVVNRNPGDLNFYAFAYTAQREDNNQFVGIGGDEWRYYLRNGRLPYGPK